MYNTTKGFIGGSFAKFIRQEISDYNDIDIYFDFDQLPELMAELTAKGVGVIEHPDNEIVSFSAQHNGFDIMVFNPCFEYETEDLVGFTLLSRATMDKIYSYAAKIDSKV